MNQETVASKAAPQLWRHVRRRYYLILAIAAVMLGIGFALDFSLMEDFPFIDLVFCIPILFTAIVLGAAETMAVGLGAVLLCLASENAEDAHINIWTASALVIFTVAAALAAAWIRRYRARVATPRQALELSPLAYAEFSFPSLELAWHNEAFTRMTEDCGDGSFSIEGSFGVAAAPAIHDLVREAVDTRAKAECTEFKLVSGSGRTSFW